MPDTPGQIIEVELPNGKILQYPASMPIEQIKADASAKWENNPQRSIPFKEGGRPNTGTNPVWMPALAIAGMAGGGAIGAGIGSGLLTAETLPAMGRAFQKGFGNGFKGKPAGPAPAGPPPAAPRSFPPNVVKSKPSASDIMENVLGKQRNGWADPRGTGMDYGPQSDPQVEAIRQFISQLLGAPK